MKLKRNFSILLSIFFVLVLMTACGAQLSESTQVSPLDSSGIEPSQTRGVDSGNSEQTIRVESTHTPKKTPVFDDRSTTTAIPTFTATASLEPSPTPSPTPIHPLMIEVMRQQDYPGSEIIFEETLEDGANYDRYIISYQSEGNKIFALLTIPYGEIPETGWPVIIFNHGYIPPESYRTTERYVNYVDVFARNGYIILRSDYRGHGFSEGEPRSSYQSPGYTADVLNAVASIQQFEDADPTRIGMWGHSMGGNITLRSMVVTNEIKAGVIWGGVVVSYPDMFELWWGSNNRNISTPDPTSRRGAWRREWFDTYGSFDENPGFWESISPNSYLMDLSGPLQLHHGTGDASVPYALSEILHEEGLALGKPVDLYLYEGDDHNLTNYFWTAMQRSVDFFDLHVKGENER